MTEYEILMKKSDKEFLKSIEFSKKGEKELAKFHRNASYAFKEKARNLPVFEMVYTKIT